MQYMSCPDPYNVIYMRLCASGVLYYVPSPFHPLKRDYEKK